MQIVIPCHYHDKIAIYDTDKVSKPYKQEQSAPSVQQPRVPTNNTRVPVSVETPVPMPGLALVPLHSTVYPTNRPINPIPILPTRPTSPIPEENQTTLHITPRSNSGSLPPGHTPFSPFHTSTISRNIYTSPQNKNTK